MTETIAAIASPPGMGAVALVRVSGERAFSLTGKVLALSKQRPVKDRHATLTHVLDADGDIIDEVLITQFTGPKSYTGEDTVEIACHGGVLVTQRVLKRLLEVGIHPAAAGEFSQRAFLNGKMDLTQAEAVMDLISAQTELGMRAAHEQLRGTLGQEAETIRADILSIAAHVEAFIDFPDEDIDTDTGQVLAGKITSVIEKITRLLATAEQGRILREGLRTVIYGVPNAGKSSLLNCLLGYDRAIVSDIAGTTRDTVEEVLNLRGIPVRLIDTAGMRKTDDRIEQQGVQRTLDQVETADLILELVDGTEPRGELLTAEQITGRHHVLIVNKSDQETHSDWSDMNDVVRISCATRDGLDSLLDHLAEKLSLSSGEWGGHAVAINLRHQSCLNRSLIALQAAVDTLDSGQSAEFISVELREGMEAIGEIAGRIDTEELLGEIFSSFCIGK